MKTTKTIKTRFSPELRERYIRLVYEQHGEHRSQRASIESVAAKIGCNAQTLESGIKRNEIDAGTRAGVSSADQGRVKELDKVLLKPIAAQGQLNPAPPQCSA